MSTAQQKVRSVAEHQAEVCQLVAPLAPRRHAPTLGETLACDVSARWPVPPFANSAMDGFLVRTADLTAHPSPRLQVLCDVAAGSLAQTPHPGTAVRIMTGAPVPEEHQDLCVVPVEDTDASAGPGEAPDYVTILAVPKKTHIRAAGENVAYGDVVARQGAVIDPGAIAAFASVGVTEVVAHPRPRVAVVSSGDELIELGDTAELAEGLIPDSNRPMLAALAQSAGAGEVISLHSADNPQACRAILDQAAARADLVITSGGVSAGAYDVLKAVGSSTEGSAIAFGSVNQKPGSPQGWGTWNNTPIICLPGNPVASFVSFHLYARPAMDILAGREPRTSWLTARWEGHQLKQSSRPSYTPVTLHAAGDLVARPVLSGGVHSHFVSSLVGAQGLALATPDPAKVKVFPFLSTL
ncbi:gephyrin-like molybdotransferase Glp [Corynebacterium tapiri]|uniref:molybdopterin molybdotransferase MoeA n=1 Tax=Corynebacterium tapiri TaxID=1448266 RepID=UPI0015D5821A|nr:gephyrin-like molybdotransferase Glp [Corynebacterium tapiri]